MSDKIELGALIPKVSSCNFSQYVLVFIKFHKKNSFIKTNLRQILLVLIRVDKLQNNERLFNCLILFCTLEQ